LRLLYSVVQTFSMLLMVRFCAFEIRDHDFTAGQNLFGS